MQRPGAYSRGRVPRVNDRQRHNGIHANNSSFGYGNGNANGNASGWGDGYTSPSPRSMSMMSRGGSALASLEIQQELVAALAKCEAALKRKTAEARKLGGQVGYRDIYCCAVAYSAGWGRKSIEYCWCSRHTVYCDALWSCE